MQNQSHSNIAKQDGAQIPSPKSFAALYLPAVDPDESKRFYTDVLGAEPIEDGSTLQMKLGELTVALGKQAGGATPVDAEYPHYAFTVTADEFLGLKRRLDAYGVPTNEPWTRKGSSVALMYFRDPSGNQFELYCKTGFTAQPLRIGSKAGGDYEIDFPALSYKKLKPPAKGAEPPEVRLSGWNHMTVPVRDLAEAKRFLVTVLNGTVILDHKIHVTVLVGDWPLGVAPTKGGWTAADAEFPHYTFLASAEDLVPLRERLEEFGAPTSDLATRNGVEAWFYFRDPSGNLFEFNCPKGCAGTTRRVKSAGGDYAVDLRSLCYSTWRDAAARKG